MWKVPNYYNILPKEYFSHFNFHGHFIRQIVLEEVPGVLFYGAPKFTVLESSLFPFVYGAANSENLHGELGLTDGMQYICHVCMPFCGNATTSIPYFLLTWALLKR